MGELLCYLPLHSEAGVVLRGDCEDHWEQVNEYVGKEGQKEESRLHPGSEGMNRIIWSPN